MNQQQQPDGLNPSSEIDWDALAQATLGAGAESATEFPDRYSYSIGKGDPESPAALHKRLERARIKEHLERMRLMKTAATFGFPPEIFVQAEQEMGRFQDANRRKYLPPDTYVVLQNPVTGEGMRYPIMPLKPNAMLWPYVRVSTEEQAAQGLSLASQEQAIREWYFEEQRRRASAGKPPLPMLSPACVAEKRSASKRPRSGAMRPRLHELLLLTCLGLSAGIVVLRPNRLYRIGGERNTFIPLINIGRAFSVEGGLYGSLTVADEVTAKAMMLVDETLPRVISDAVKTSLASLRKGGAHSGGRAPWGFKLVRVNSPVARSRQDGKATILRIDEDTIVDRLRAEYLLSVGRCEELQVSLFETAQIMDAEGIPVPPGSKYPRWVINRRYMQTHGTLKDMTVKCLNGGRLLWYPQPGYGIPRLVDTDDVPISIRSGRKLVRAWMENPKNQHVIKHVIEAPFPFDALLKLRDPNNPRRRRGRGTFPNYFDIMREERHRQPIPGFE